MDSSNAGFDRRSLIKKGLVVGGIAATAPVISTFNVSAFAQSAGVYRLVYAGPANGAIVKVADVASVCNGIAPATWTAAAPNPSDLSFTVNAAGSTVVFTLVDNQQTACVITEAQRATSPPGPSCAAAGTIAAGGQSATFASPTPASTSFQYYFIVTCT